MRRPLVIALLCLGLAVSSTNAAWGFGSKKDVDSATPIVSYDPANPIPAQNPEASLADDFTPLLTAKPGRAIPPPYHGVEYKLGGLFFRPALFVPEAFILGALVLYALACFLGARRNRAQAREWFLANAPAFQREFAVFGMEKELFQDDGADEFVAYATGRRGVESAQVSVKTGSKHDVLVALYHFARTASDLTYDSGANRVTLQLLMKPPVGTPNSKFVFALCKRTGLKNLCDQRWDLRNFTNTSEYAGLPKELIVMGESGEFYSALFKPDVGLLESVKPGAPGAEYFESLVITDMPHENPIDLSDEPSLPTETYRLILTLRLPPGSDLTATAPFVTLACNIADVLHEKPKLISEIAVSKLSKKRAEVSASLRKDIVAAETAKEAERLSALSAEKKKSELAERELKYQSMSKEDRIKAIEKDKAKDRKEAIKKMTKKQKGKPQP